jgi:hypothetical protein
METKIRNFGKGDAVARGEFLREDGTMTDTVNVFFHIQEVPDYINVSDVLQDVPLRIEMKK